MIKKCINWSIYGLKIVRKKIKKIKLIKKEHEHGNDNYNQCHAHFVFGGLNDSILL